MTKEMSVEPIEKYSSKTWKQWVKELDSKGARKLKHNDIAILTRELIDNGWWDKKEQPKTNWWAQGIAICYEQHCGLRIAGQQADGLFAVTVSKTITGDVDKVFKKFSKIGIENKHDDVRISHTPKRSYWRTNLADKTKLEVGFEAKGDDKVLITFSQSKIVDPTVMDKQKVYWKKIAEKVFG